MTRSSDNTRPIHKTFCQITLDTVCLKTSCLTHRLQHICFQIQERRVPNLVLGEGGLRLFKLLLEPDALFIPAGFIWIYFSFAAVIRGSRRDMGRGIWHLDQIRVNLEPLRAQKLIMEGQISNVLTQVTMLSTSCFCLPALRRSLSTQMCHRISMWHPLSRYFSRPSGLDAF